MARAAPRRGQARDVRRRAVERRRARRGARGCTRGGSRARRCVCRAGAGRPRRDRCGGRTLEGLLTSGRDPALEALKAEYRTEFAIALREAIAVLGAEDRTLLRQSIVDELSIDAIGVAYGVHRATAARWLPRARAAQVAATHKRLAERLKLPVEQIESGIRLGQSKLEAAMIRFLEEES